MSRLPACGHIAECEQRDLGISQRRVPFGNTCRLVMHLLILLLDLTMAQCGCSLYSARLAHGLRCCDMNPGWFGHPPCSADTHWSPAGDHYCFLLLNGSEQYTVGHHYNIWSNVDLWNFILNYIFLTELSFLIIFHFWWAFYLEQNWLCNCLKLHIIDYSLLQISIPWLRNWTAKQYENLCRNAY